MPEVLGIIAGSGQFPILVARGARAQGLGVVAVGFTNMTPPDIAPEVDAYQEMHIGQLGRLIDYFREHGVQRVVMCGAISKPKALDVRPDWRAAKLLFKMRGRGDDVILRAVAEELETENMRIAPPHLFVPNLLTPQGVLSRRKPDHREVEDIHFGLPIAEKLGEMDIGQCLVVKHKIVVAVEGIEGTDACVRRAGELAGEGCVVIKIFKPGQDSRVDMPALGLKTIQTLVEAKAACLAVAAGKSLFFDLDDSLELANEHGLSVIGLHDDIKL